MQLKNQQFKHIENIIFDFGNVLIDFDILRTIRAMEQLGLSTLNPEDIHPHNAGVFLQLELGEISTREFLTKLKSYANDRIPTDLELHYAWNMMLRDYDFERFALLDKLRDNYKLYLLTNTNLPHREYLIQKFNAENPRQRTFESYFDICFYSDAMHLRKPDAEIYRQTILQAGIEPERTLFIDDNLCNLTGAAEVGLHTYHLTQPETILDLFI